ncbi:RNA polymerase sigma factor [Cryptosporangium arvum]|uniref:RNA polymerase sigma factor, sigma-70 family n=1 Tax=Cryptosporangium arvum DSM 44712 TaxID=927661 RepID=A0A010Z1I2_9ACTN|nr:sigma-70 family RNA polymerase sigma factor [Cryptosporangium arvum]EXG81258.1 RNA polymerase sigma factor, sigma-70 family [Cryptosporangium arvum DSM 44712]
MTDELLVVRSQLGERDAFADLVRAWHDPLTNYVRRMLGAGRSDDVVQEVWLAVVRGLPRLRDPVRFPPWLFSIARRAVTNRLRDEYARPELGAEVEGVGPDIDDAVLDRAAVVASVGALPVREREVVVLFYLLDLSLESCAEICGIPVGTVKSRLSRGRRMLRDEFTQKGFAR